MQISVGNYLAVVFQNTNVDINTVTHVICNVISVQDEGDITTIITDNPHATLIRLVGSWVSEIYSYSCKGDVAVSISQIWSSSSYDRVIKGLKERNMI